MSKPKPCCDHEQRFASLEQRLADIERRHLHILGVLGDTADSDRRVADRRISAAVTAELSGRAELIGLARTAGAGRGHLIAVEGGKAS